MQDVADVKETPQPITESAPVSAEMAAMDEAITTTDEVLSDKDLAKSYRSQADAM